MGMDVRNLLSILQIKKGKESQLSVKLNTNCWCLSLLQSYSTHEIAILSHDLLVDDKLPFLDEMTIY